MLINVKHLETGGFSEDKRLDFKDKPDLSHIRQWGHTPYPQPVEVNGEIVSHLGMMTISYKARAIRQDSCARCAESIEVPVEIEFSHRILDDSATDVYTDDEAVFVSGGVLDLAELVASDLLLSQDQVSLCFPDCQGLCPFCGCNLNREGCDCTVSQDDSTSKDNAIKR